MTPQEKATARKFKRIADVALDKLSKLNIQSSNKFWTRNRDDVGRRLGTARERREGLYTYEDYVEDVKVSRVGNCGEKGITFGWFASLHPEAAGAGIYTVNAVDWDHMWAVMTEARLQVDSVHGLSSLGVTGIILDGWSEDWYFPNMDRLDKILLDTWRGATPFAYWVMHKVEAKGRKFKVNGVIQDPS